MTKPTYPNILQKLQSWQELKFGLFIHWGIYSVWGAVESWPIVEKEPYGRDSLASWEQSGRNPETFMQMYFALHEQFNPDDFNPEQWAIDAKKAGMKYLVFTTKHHDGFCMYDSQYTEYRITSPSCPYSNHPNADITRQLFDAFRKHGFWIGVYYSKADWHHNDYWCTEYPRTAREVNYHPEDHPEKWLRYTRFVHNQIKELLTKYGPVDILWLDGEWVRSPQENIQMESLATLARNAQPDILIVDRHVGSAYENYRTPEQTVPDHPPDYPWETCMTMGEQWSYKPNDRYKSTREIIHLLIDITAKGGNLLLNIGPDARGRFDKQARKRLEEIGQWMDINAPAIYPTKPIAPYKVDNLCVSQKDNQTYVFYLAGANEKSLPSTLRVRFIAQATAVRLLGRDSMIPYQFEKGSLVLSIPQRCRVSPPCRSAWVFEITDATLSI